MKTSDSDASPRLHASAPLPSALKNELRVFISSTFRDLQEEREHLVKKIFPEIRALCRERGVTFTEIDLRWGITEEEAERNGIISICLEEIDRCRPWFIGILGERYGYVPDGHDTSITEMEIVHGVLANPSTAHHNFFYFRDRTATPDGFIDVDAEPIERLADLKRRIRHSGLPVRESFTSPVELGEWIDADLRRVIEAEYPAGTAPSALELERRSHAAFAASRKRAYIPTQAYLEQFNEWIDRSTRMRQHHRQSGDIVPLVVSGESGLGKSSLAAHLAETYRSHHPTAFVIEHYVGATTTGGSATAVMRHIIEEIRDRFAISDEAPFGPDDLERSFPTWLYRAEYHADRLGIPMLLVIDAVNQLDQTGQQLEWLPRTIPSGIMVMISTTPGDSAECFAERAWEHLDVRPIDDEKVRTEIVRRYLDQFHKSITDRQVRRIASDAKGASPLFLRVVAEELRLHGEHETIDSLIDHFAGAPHLLRVFELVLERLERDYGARGVRDLLTAIWASRSGLSEEELVEIAGVNRLELSRLLFAVDYHFVRRDGLLGFFHDYLRRAVENRYLRRRTSRVSRWKRLADYFERSSVTLRSSLETLHALEMLGEANRLNAALTTIERFELVWPTAQQEVLRLWAAVDSDVVTTTYEAGVADWIQRTAPSHDRIADVLDCIGALFDVIGAWNEATRIHLERLTHLSAINDRNGESRTLARLAWLAHRMGKTAEASDMARRAEEVAREGGDRGAVGASVAIRGIVHWRCGEYDEALACFVAGEEIARETNDRRALAHAVGNRGIIYTDRDEYDTALACFREQHEIGRSLGDPRIMTDAIRHRGIVYLNSRKHDDALACFREQEEIARRLGDRVNMAQAIGNQGIIHANRGAYDEALACRSEQESIARQIGHRRSLADALGGRGIVHDSRREYSEALNCFYESEQIYRELGERNSLAYALGYRGIVHTRLGEYAEALDCFHDAAQEHRAVGVRYGLVAAYEGMARTLLEVVTSDVGSSAGGSTLPTYLMRHLPNAVDSSTSNNVGWQGVVLRCARDNAMECLAISREFSDTDRIYSMQTLLARITAAEGSVSEAIETLRSMVDGAEDDEQRGDVHYWLWRFGALDTDHRSAALCIYQTLFEKTPNYDYHKRIEDLCAAGEGS